MEEKKPYRFCSADLPRNIKAHRHFTYPSDWNGRSNGVGQNHVADEEFTHEGSASIKGVVGVFMGNILDD